MRGALAWIGLHARAATVAEEALAVEIAERDAKVPTILFSLFFCSAATKDHRNNEHGETKMA